MNEFPKGFLWGAATSAHQVEGGNRNDWSEWEKSEVRSRELEARIKDEKFRKSFPAHILNASPSPLDPANYISGAACDHYHRYEEDLDIAKSLGHNAHRFSIEWSRIEPEEGKFDEKEIEHYRKVIAALRARGMEPFVTLWHWTAPIWFQQRGGWLSPRSSYYFTRFVSRIAETFSSDVQFWCTLNEPEVFISYGYIAGIRPPQAKSIWKAAVAFHLLARAHRSAYRALHRVASSYNRPCLVGIAKHNKYFVAADASIKNKFFTALARFFWNEAFMLHIRGYQDYIGLNYYNRNVIDFGWHKPRKGLYNLEISPEGFYESLIAIHKYGKPIYVLENGIDDARDVSRPSFIKEHIEAIMRAKTHGADIRGYFHWSLLDNFEWESGFWPRFGLVEIDYQPKADPPRAGKTLERKIRPSAFEYKKIIEANGLLDFPET